MIQLELLINHYYIFSSVWPPGPTPALQSKTLWRRPRSHPPLPLDPRRPTPGPHRWTSISSSSRALQVWPAPPIILSLQYGRWEAQTAGSSSAFCNWVNMRRLWQFSFYGEQKQKWRCVVFSIQSERWETHKRAIQFVVINVHGIFEFKEGNLYPESKAGVWHHCNVSFSLGIPGVKSGWLLPPPALPPRPTASQVIPVWLRFWR